ncbi:MAG TPA: LuxR C-terminal-related transcriptional regulator [Candidatus Limnocylindrales bacterium]|jgi:predicted ATPase/DNA-binding CsgD family transcriptional regulator
MTLLGRDDAVARLARVVLQDRMVTLTGPGGVGKTTLARAVLDRLRDGGHEAWFVDGVAVHSSAGLLRAIAAALELVAGPADEATALDDYFGRREAWLVLDNLENLVADGVAAVIEPRLAAAPGLHIIATSRVPLAIAGEVQVPVPGLELPSGDDPGAVAASPSGALFLARAHAMGADLKLDAPAAAEASAILRRLDGMPLAIELAAGRTRVFGLAELRRRLDDPRTLASQTVADGRHRSLATVLAWSIALLQDDERRVLDAASRCPGPFDVAVLEALAPGADVVSALDGLVRAGLVTPDADEDGRRWFRVLDTIRAACLRSLDPGREAELDRRLATHVDALVAAIGRDLWGPRQAEATRLAGRLRPLITGVLEWAEGNDPAAGLRIITALDRYWGQSPWDATPLRWLDALLAAATPDDPSRPYAEVVRVEQILVRDGPAAALDLARGAIEIARAAGVRHVMRRAITTAAQVCLGNGDREAAGRCLLEASEYVDDPEVREGLRIAGWAHEAIARGLDEDARASLLASAAAHERSGDAWNAAVTLLCCAQVEWRLGEAEASAATAVHADELLQSAGFPDDQRPVVIAALGNAGRVDVARAVLRDAWPVVERAHPVARVELLEAAVPLVHAQGRMADALRIVAAADRARAGLGWAVDELNGWLVAEHRSVIERALDPVAIGLALRDGASMDVHEAYAIAVAEPDGTPVTTTSRTVERLTTREVEVLALVGSGQSDTEIAEALFISPKTASVHVSNVKGKLGAGSRLEVALRAREMGLVDGAVRRGDRARG